MMKYKRVICQIYLSRNTDNSTVFVSDNVSVSCLWGYLSIQLVNHGRLHLTISLNKKRQTTSLSSIALENSGSCPNKAASERSMHFLVICYSLGNRKSPHKWVHYPIYHKWLTRPIQAYDLTSLWSHVYTYMYVHANIFEELAIQFTFLLDFDVGHIVYTLLSLNIMWNIQWYMFVGNFHGTFLSLQSIAITQNYMNLKCLHTFYAWQSM